MIQTSDLEHLGPALKMLRLASGQEQKAISEVTGMSRSQVSRYERGRDIPNLVTITKFLATVSADFADLQGAIVAAREGRPWIRDASQTISFLVRLLRPVISEIVQSEVSNAQTHEEDATHA